MGLSKVKEYESSKDLNGLIRLLEDSDAGGSYKSVDATNYIKTIAD